LLNNKSHASEALELTKSDIAFPVDGNAMSRSWLNNWVPALLGSQANRPKNIVVWAQYQSLPTANIGSSVRRKPLSEGAFRSQRTTVNEFESWVYVGGDVAVFLICGVLLWMKVNERVLGSAFRQWPKNRGA
jgi:hypothetical protein